MRSLLAVTLLVSLAACGAAEQDEPTAAVDCLDVPPAIGKAIVGTSEGVKMKFISAGAVESPEREGVYFVAVKFSAAGGDEEVGVWARTSLKPNEGMTLSVDGTAKAFSNLPDADSVPAKIGGAEPGVDDARACV